MLRRLTTVVAVTVLAALLVAPARADHTTDHTIAQMTAHYRDPGLELQNRPFALLYLRTTEGMRDANNAGEFSDPLIWDTEVIPTFADYYLNAYAAWQRGDLPDVDPAWRIAFRADPGKLNCTQLIYLGINAHVNNDLAFMIEDMGPRYTYRTTSRWTTSSPSGPGRSSTPRSSGSCAPTCSPRRPRPTPTWTSSPGGSSPGTTPSGS